MKPSRELRDLVLGLYRDWSAGDPSFVDELFSESEDLSGFGTDPDEWWTGPAFREIFKTQITEAPVDAEPGDLLAFTEGSTGWVVDNPTITWGDTSVALRLSLFFHLEGGRWRIVHSHVSIGVANEEAVGFSFTTSIDAVADTVQRERPRVAATSGTVTIVFTDVEGSTALNERLGDAAWRELLQRHIDIVQRVTSQHGGETVERAGDGFMLAFESAASAVRCAIDLQRETEHGDVTSGVRIRIGAHTGEPIRDAAAFYGRDVAFAARVASEAKGGEIIVSPTVRELIRGASDLELDPPRSCDLKGFEGTQQVYPVRWKPLSGA